MAAEQEVNIQSARVPSIRAVIRASRPKQMVKNGLVLIPLFFTVNIWYNSGDIGGMTAIAGRAFAALGIFVLISAAVYFINDSVDVEKDRVHPLKRFRPIAAGRISVPWAIGISAVFIVGGMAAAVIASTPLAVAAGSYLAINIAYSLWLKNVVLLDVMIVASGFVIRAVAGSIAINHAVIRPEGIPLELDLAISPWLYVVTALGALFLALAKRRNELHNSGESSENQRSIISEYSIPLLDNLINIVTTATLVSYTLYTLNTGASEANVPDNNSMMLTIPFVAYGIFRYLYLIHIRGVGESPEEILIHDKPLLINIFLWLVTGSSVLMWSRLTNTICAEYFGICF